MKSVVTKIVFLLCLFPGCASVPTYKVEGPKNFSVHAEIGGLGEPDIEIRVHEYLGNCKYNFLGSHKASSPQDTQIHLPTGKPLLLSIFFVKQFFLASQPHYSKDFQFYREVRADQSLTFELWQKKNTSGWRMMRKNKNSKDAGQEIDSLPLPMCRTVSTISGV